MEIAPEAVLQMAAAHRGFLDLIESNPDLSVYMVTTGGGEWARQRVSPDERSGPDMAKRFNLQLAFGDPLPERVTRGFVLARLANFLGGHAAAHPSVAEAIAAMLDGRTLPPVPRRGQGGSGEIIPLGHLFGPDTRNRHRAQGAQRPRQRVAVRGRPRRGRGAGGRGSPRAGGRRLRPLDRSHQGAARELLVGPRRPLGRLGRDRGSPGVACAARGRGRRAQELPDPRQLADCAPGAWSGPSGRRAGETGREHLPGGGHRQPRLRAARRRSSDGTDVLDGWLPQQRRLAGPRCHERLVGRPLPVG